MTTNDFEGHYAKLLDNIKNLEIKLEESEEKELDLYEAQLNRFKQEICGTISTKHNSNDETEKNDELVIVEDENSKRLIDDLNDETIGVNQKEKIIQLIAELAKNEECRDFLIKLNVFVPLDKCLLNKDADDSTRIQICRAIGNLCYYNDNARLALLNSCGIENLINLCKYCTKQLDFTNKSSDEVKNMNTLLSVSLGCLHNLTNENETLRKAVYGVNIMSILKEYIPYLKQFKGTLIHFGSCIENLLQLDEGKEQFSQEKLALNLFEQIDKDVLLNLNDYAEDFFLILNLIIDQVESKSLMAQTNFLANFLSFIEENVDKTELIRHCCLFLVGLIVSDEQIEVIFNYKNSLLLDKAIDWLNQANDLQLHVTSAVIIANYLRNDANVLKIIKDSRQPHVRIVNLLENYSTYNANKSDASLINVDKKHSNLQIINVVHSLLGALRNFCVAENMLKVNTREEILKLNVFDVIFAIIKNEHLDNQDVKFKALSIIRLLIRNCTEKTGLATIFKEENLQILASLTNNSSSIEHLGIKGESSRLACYLPLVAKTDVNIGLFLKFEMIPVVCEQLKSEYPIMINESLLALNVLCTLNYAACIEQLKKSELSDNLNKVFEKSKESLPVEMRLNAFRLFRFLFEKNFFSKDEPKIFLKSFQTLLNSLENTTSEAFLRSHLVSLITLIEEAAI